MGIRFNEFSNKLTNSANRSRARVVESILAPTPEREHFFSSDDYSVGKFVLSEGKVYEIIDKRSNYVVLIDESGSTCKKFPASITPTTESVV